MADVITDEEKYIIREYCKSKRVYVDVVDKEV
jgi:hypothetical protein